MLADKLKIPIKIEVDPGKLVDKTIGLRATTEEETGGLDMALHKESAYDFSALGTALTGGSSVPAAGQDAKSGSAATKNKKVDA